MLFLLLAAISSRHRSKREEREISPVLPMRMTVFPRGRPTAIDRVHVRQERRRRVWIAAQDGSTPPQQITTGGSAQRYAPSGRPTARKIVFGDKNGKVYVVTVATKQMQMIVDAPNGQIQDYELSPKGNYLPTR